MAIEIVAQAKVSTLGEGQTWSEKFDESRTETDRFSSYTVIGSTSLALDLGNIEDSEVLGIWLKAQSDGCYFVPNSTLAPAAITASIAGLYVPEGQAVFVTYASTAGVHSLLGAPIVQGTSSTAAIEYMVYGATT